MTTTQSLSVSDVIAAVGGRARAAQLCGVSLDAIRKWKEKNYIPPKNWPALVRHGGERVTYIALEALWEQVRCAARRPSVGHDGAIKDGLCCFTVREE